MRLHPAIAGGLLMASLNAFVCASQDDRASGASQKQTQSPVHPWCSDLVSSGTSTLVLTADSLGPLKAGVRKAELRRICPGLADTMWEGAEGIPRLVTRLRLAGRDIGLIEWGKRDSALSRVIITAGIVRTTDSIGVGTTVGELRRRLGTLRAGYDDAGAYVWTDEQPRFSYLLRLRVTSLMRVPDDISRNVQLIPDSASVKALIYVGRR